MTHRIRPFTSLKTNVKVQTEVPLGPLTLIVGEAESGKSAIGNDSVRLALTGKHKVGHNPSDLLQLALNPRSGLEVRMDGPDGAATWTLKVGPDGKAKRPDAPDFTGALANLTEDERAHLLPTYSLSDFMQARGQKKVREALLRRWGGGIEALQAPMGLLPVEKLAWEAACRAVENKVEEKTSASILAGLSEVFRKSALERSRMVKPLMAEIERRKQELRNSTRPSDMLPTLEQQLKAIQTKPLIERDKQEIERITNGRKASTERLELLREIAQKAQSTLDAVQREYDRVETEHAATLKELRTLEDKVIAQQILVKACDRQIEEGHSKCPLCTSPSIEIQDLKQRLVKKIEVESEARARLKDKFGTSEKTLLGARKGLDDARFSLRTQLTQLENAEKAFRDLDSSTNDRLQQLERSIKLHEKEVAKAPALYPGSTEETLKADIEAIKLSEQRRNELESEVARLRGLEDEARMYGLLERQAIQMQKDVLAEIGQRASNEVSQRMLNGRRIEFDPVDCEWYIITEQGGRHPYGAFCGTQETAFKLAFARAWTANAPLRVAIFDDYDLIGLSQKGMQQFFTMCEQAVASGDLTQVIVVWNRPDEAPKSTDWNSILVEAGGTWTKL
jgi:hypothetical protein